MPTLWSHNGIYALAAGSVPYYAIGNFSSFERSDESAAVTPDELSKTAAGNDYVEFKLNSKFDGALLVDVTAEDGISLYENQGFQGNEARVVLKTDGDTRGDKWVRLRVIDENGRTLYNGKHNIKVEEPFVAEINFEQAVADNSTHWRAVVTVKNPANTSDISGSIKLLAPETTAQTARTRTFTSLKPGKTATFVFNMPVSVTKKVIPVTAKIALNNGPENTISKNMEVTTASYADKKPSIDGVISDNEWSYQWFGADESGNIRDLLNAWRGPDDLSFSGTMMWDEEYLYMLAVVTDDVHCVSYSPQTPYNMYKGDGIQFGIDDRETFAGGDETNFNEIGIGEFPGMDGIVFRYNTVYGLPDDSIIEGCETAVVRHDAYTLYEVKIPWSGIFFDGFAPKAGASYRFAALVNDNDGAGRRGWIEYGQGIGSGKSVTKFGSLTLLK